MKKVLLSLSIIFCAGSAAMAQHSDHDGHNHAAPAKAAPAKASSGKKAAAPTTVTANAVPTESAKPTNMSFTKEEYDFGTIAEGPAAEYEFTFTNKGTSPVIINNVQASCGCTTPSWPKDPILPGKSGSIKASYATTGRPGPFTKTITVLSNTGSNVLTIRGTVEKAPETSVPQNTSMLKTH